MDRDLKSGLSITRQERNRLSELSQQKSDVINDTSGVPRGGGAVQTPSEIPKAL